MFSLVDILAARKVGISCTFFDFIKLFQKIALFLVYKKYRDFPRAGARAPRKRKDQSDAPLAIRARNPIFDRIPVISALIRAP